MADAVSLRAVVNEIDGLPEEFHAYLNRKTGETFSAGEEERSTLEDVEDGEELVEDMPPWQRESVNKLREILASEDWIELPSPRDFDEYRVMEDFVEALEDVKLQDELLDDIKGRGAFRRFKDRIHRHEIQERWYKYRDEQLSKFVAEWLDAQGIAYQA